MTVLNPTARATRISAATAPARWKRSKLSAACAGGGNPSEFSSWRIEMGKGSRRRPCQVPKSEYDANFEAVFGKKKLNTMSDEDKKKLGCPLCGDISCDTGCSDQSWRPGSYDRDREAGGDVLPNGHDGGDLHAEGQGRTPAEPFWTGPGYRGEYDCPHGIGHGNHVHGCDGCCRRDDFPLKGKSSDE